MKALPFILVFLGALAFTIGYTGELEVLWLFWGIFLIPVALIVAGLVWGILRYTRGASLPHD